MNAAYRSANEGRVSDSDALTGNFHHIFVLRNDYTDFFCAKEEWSHDHPK
jgi:hypothetical protein